MIAIEAPTGSVAAGGPDAAGGWDEGREIAEGGGREPAFFIEPADRGNAPLLARIARLGPADRAAYADGLRSDKSEPPPPSH